MEIIYLGHSSFLLKGKDCSVATDPFDPDSVGFRFPKTSAKVVTISHEHEDHNNAKAVSDVKKVISGPGEYEVEGVSMIGFPTFHDAKKGQEMGNNTVFLFEMEGLRLAHLGDLGHMLSEDTVSALGNIDILMVPVGGQYTIDAKVAAEVVRAIDPRIVIPMHYKVPGLNPKTFSETSDEKPFVSELGYQMRTEKKLSVKTGTLSEDSQEIVVLEIS